MKYLGWRTIFFSFNGGNYIKTNGLLSPSFVGLYIYLRKSDNKGIQSYVDFAAGIYWFF